MKRAIVKEVALAVLIRVGFDAATAGRLADLIAHEPIPAGDAHHNDMMMKPEPAPARPGPRSLEEAISRAKEKH